MFGKQKQFRKVKRVVNKSESFGIFNETIKAGILGKVIRKLGRRKHSIYIMWANVYALVSAFL